MSAARLETIDPGIPGALRPLVRLIAPGECEHPAEAIDGGVCRCGQVMLDFRIVEGVGPAGVDQVVYTRRGRES